MDRRKIVKDTTEKEVTATDSADITVAVRAFLPEAAKATGVSEIQGICLKDNTASRHVLLKCGFAPVFEGVGEYQGETREIFRSVWRMPGGGSGA